MLCGSLIYFIGFDLSVPAHLGTVTFYLDCVFLLLPSGYRDEFPIQFSSTMLADDVYVSFGWFCYFDVLIPLFLRDPVPHMTTTMLIPPLATLKYIFVLKLFTVVLHSARSRLIPILNTNQNYNLAI